MPNISDNRVLRALDSPDLDRLGAHLVGMDLSARTPLVRPDAPASHVYFPAAGVVSLVQPLDDGSAVEAGLIGADGFVGVHTMLGADTTPSEAVVLLPGYGWRLPVGVFRDELTRNAAFRHQALLYAQALNVQVMYSVACNARHRVVQRLARWLSAGRDRVATDDLPISQEYLSTILGCRRAGVTIAIAALRTKGLISNSINMVHIVNRDGLRAAACSCYESVKKESERLLG